MHSSSKDEGLRDIVYKISVVLETRNLTLRVSSGFDFLCDSSIKKCHSYYKMQRYINLKYILINSRKMELIFN